MFKTLVLSGFVFAAAQAASADDQAAGDTHFYRKVCNSKNPIRQPGLSFIENCDYISEDLIGTVPTAEALSSLCDSVKNGAPIRTLLLEQCGNVADLEISTDSYLKKTSCASDAWSQFVGAFTGQGACETSFELVQ